MPVVAAVNGFCVGGGIGLVGNADVIVASDDATFGLPEVDRGALGAATHLSRLVPQHMMRRMYFTAATVDAATLHHFGSVHEVVPRDELDEAALRVARDIAAKDTRVIRAAKEALNLIDVQTVQLQLPYGAGLHVRAEPRRGRPTSIATRSRDEKGSNREHERQADHASTTAVARAARAA